MRPRLDEINARPRCPANLSRKPTPRYEAVPVWRFTVEAVALILLLGFGAGLAAYVWGWTATIVAMPLAAFVSFLFGYLR